MQLNSPPQHKAQTNFELNRGPPGFILLDILSGFLKRPQKLKKISHLF